MKVLLLSAEVAPFAKVGGLADVAGSLPKALLKLGLDVRVILPSYQLIEHSGQWPVETVIDHFPVRLSPKWTKPAHLKLIKHRGVQFYLLGTDQWFTESVSSQTIYLPGSDQHLFFAKAALEACARMNWIPDVIHCNDWHTGFVPVFMRETGDAVLKNSASVFTIHNLAYQGEFGEEILEKVDLPMSLFNLEQLETYGRVNFLKAGCVYSDQVNTVSPSYAKEIQTPEFGCRLEGLMQHLAQFGRLSGILNGIDYDEFNPETDCHIAANFSAQDLSGKSKCKEDLQHALKLPSQGNHLLMGVVSRLSSQKGMDLVLSTAERLFNLKVQLVVQGLGDPWLANKFRELQHLYPAQFRFVEKFDPDLAQQVYAGSDVFLMPSAFEPCGLGQMIAMRYGTIPLVRRTGGLADTVSDKVNGFVFEQRSEEELMQTCRRALACYRNEAAWKKMMLTAMSTDFSWDRSAKEYIAMYERGLHDRRNGTSAKAC